MADFAPDWTPYRYGFDNPIIYVDPDGLFESKEAAKSYAKEEGIRTGLFSNNKIKAQSDGAYTIENKKEHTSTRDLGGHFGVMTGVMVTPSDVMNSSFENGGLFGNDRQTETLRDGTEREIPITAGTPPGVGKGGKIPLSAIKRALKEVHKQVGSLPKSKPGKWGSPQRGNKTKGYRLEREGHPNTTNPNEKGPHINWWDYTRGKWNKGLGPGKKGAQPIEIE